MIDLLDTKAAPYFPNRVKALVEPNGLLAAGGALNPGWLLAAYRLGIFPWFNPGEPILWWFPNPRTIFHTDQIHLSKRFCQSAKKFNWQIEFDQRFAQVIDHCAHLPRNDHYGTWISAEMIDAYQRLHDLGHAHSVEVVEDGELIGGLYGVCIGKMFFAESMYSGKSGASKIALAGLAKLLHTHQFPLIDAQVGNPHLFFLGAKSMPATDFAKAIAQLTEGAESPSMWAVRLNSQQLIAEYC